MDNNAKTSALLNSEIGLFMKSALRVVSRKPSLAWFAYKAGQYQKKAAETRKKYEAQGIQVPPYMIISTTNRCNLNCKGCYSKAQHRPAEKELSIEKLQTVIAQAKELGVSFVFLAGGEPLMRPELLEITKEHPEVIFPLFTNGLLITDEIAETLKKQKHVVPVISMEGNETETNDRRGNNVFGRLQESIRRLKQKGVFFGLSFTVTKENFGTLTDDGYIKELLKSGSRLFFYVEYIPVSEATEELVVTDEQRTSLSIVLNSFKKKFPALFVSFPGDEELFGGCLSAGRGFIHISAEGALEPCPFAPYSDTSLKDMTLKEALQSDLLRKIRENHDQLTETRGGCALWEKRDWVKSLL